MRHSPHFRLLCSVKLRLAGLRLSMRSGNMKPLIEVRKTALPEAQRRRQRPWCGKAGWSRSDQDPDTHHFLPMRYGVSMLQVVRVHPVLEGKTRTAQVG